MTDPKSEALVAAEKKLLDEIYSETTPHRTADDLYRFWRSKAIALEAENSKLQGRIEQLVVNEIASSTGPTGGWLDSPKAICAAILGKIKAERGEGT